MIKNNKEVKRIIGIGNALVDVLARIEDDAVISEMGLLRGGMLLVDEPAFHKLDGYLQKLNPHKASGGSAHNTIQALAHMGAAPGFIGKIGNDDYGRFLESNDRRIGVTPFFTVDSVLPTGVASTFISADAQRTFGTFLGAASTVHASDIHPEQLEGYDLLYIEGYLTQDHDMIDRVAKEAHEKGMRIALDLASYNFVENDREFFSHLLHDYVDLVFANEEESHAFTGSSDAIKSVTRLGGICGEAVVKIGAGGAYAYRNGEVSYAQAAHVDKVIDTTAAGDFFAGGYLWGITKGCDTKTCLELGNLLGGAVIQVYGTDIADASWDEIRKKAAQLL